MITIYRMLGKKHTRKVLILSVVCAWALSVIVYLHFVISNTSSSSKTEKASTQLIFNFTAKRFRPDMTGIYNVPRNITWIQNQHDLITKLSHFNYVIHNVRRAIIKTGDSPWRGDFPGHVKAIVGNSPHYLEELSSLPNVVTLVSAWTDSSGVRYDGKWSSLEDTSNLLIQKYYHITGSNTVCKEMTNGKPFTRHRFETVFNHQCSTNVSELLEARSMHLFILNAVQLHKDYFYPNNGDSWPQHFYTDVPQYVTYLHIIRDGFLNSLGEIVTNTHKIIPYNCRPNFSNNLNKFDPHASLYDEVFSISQYWGSTFYHFNIEDLPKIAPYLQFLKQNPHVRIHVSNINNYAIAMLSSLGISEDRLVKGSLKAKVIYLPRGTSCGYAHVQETQLLSYILRNTIPIADNSVYKKTLVLIRRSKTRHFVHHNEIANKLQILAKEYNLEFFVFNDDPLPSLDVTKDYFHRAALVVAPHGAGLSNLLFSQPGTTVLEGLCHKPDTNMCYTRLAYILGLRYHGIMSSAGCMNHVDIKAADIDEAARSLLKVMRDTHDI